MKKKDKVKITAPTAAELNLTESQIDYIKFKEICSKHKTFIESFESGVVICSKLEHLSTIARDYEVIGLLEQYLDVIKTRSTAKILPTIENMIK